jgi:hypothetical protein
MATSAAVLARDDRRVAVEYSPDYLQAPALVHSPRQSLWYRRADQAFRIPGSRRNSAEIRAVLRHPPALWHRNAHCGTSRRRDL